MGKTFFLFETAAGYALYQIEQWEQIGHVEAMEEMCNSEERFKEAVKFKAFQPFTTAADALENIRAVVEGEVTSMLSAFLGLNMPKKGAELAVVDPALGKTLTAKGFKVVYDPNVVELLRGCRLHEMKNIARLASGASAFDMDKFHVGLGHNFSRTKLQVDPRRFDKPVVNCVALLDSLTKNLNSFAMRVREWYGWHFPELIKIVNDNKLYCQTVRIIQRKDKFDWAARTAELVELLHDEELVASIKKAAGQSIGHDLSEPCMQNILNFATQVVRLEDMREHLNSHLANKLAITAPNLSTVAGNVLTGRLISHAGSLVNLAKMSASSIQILGAEKALFRALKTRSNTPKYGLIFQSNFIGKASLKHKGRAARYLANKCALAARLDCFCEVNTDVYGKRMVELLGKRMEYLAGGPPHDTSIDVMKAASQEYQAIKAQAAIDKRKRVDDDSASAGDVNAPSGVKAEPSSGSHAVEGVSSEASTPKSKKQKKGKSAKAEEGGAPPASPVTASADAAPGDTKPPKKAKKPKGDAGEVKKDAATLSVEPAKERSATVKAAKAAAAPTEDANTKVKASEPSKKSKLPAADAKAAEPLAEEVAKKRKKEKRESQSGGSAAGAGEPRDKAAKKAKKAKKQSTTQ
ncbi:nucleolar protein Nop56, putative [Babesia caballi]|uniref:Nucleolar protein 56 n=1 Tax=Babesia caballi TaxID=5871 RepID=A0AAV4LS70_BABCB|nr:nucleolar protein Nop56, putative [Babesia caballi]